MHSSLLEQTIRCPFCAARLSVLLDLSAGDQSYIEDCQVCCRPMQISFDVDDDAVANLRVERAS